VSDPISDRGSVRVLSCCLERDDALRALAATHDDLRDVATYSDPELLRDAVRQIAAALRSHLDEAGVHGSHQN
jgi:hypothetical protein